MKDQVQALRLAASDRLEEAKAELDLLRRSVEAMENHVATLERLLDAAIGVEEALWDADASKSDVRAALL